MPYQHLGSFSQQKQVWTYSVLDENRFGHIQSWMMESMTGADTGFRKGGGVVRVTVNY